VQYDSYTGPSGDSKGGEGDGGVNGRAVLKSDDEGRFWYKAIVPVPYCIPDDGPVGKMLERLGRHAWRPSHMHFMFEKEGYDHLITYVGFLLSPPFPSFPPSPPRLSSPITDTYMFCMLIICVSALYLRNDPYETSDAVFGVKESLIVDLSTVTAEQAKEYGVEEGTKLLTYDFVLVTEEETRKLREELAKKAVEGLGRTDLGIVDGLPILDVD
jgi:hypothetical protein